MQKQVRFGAQPTGAAPQPLPSPQPQRKHRQTGAHGLLQKVAQEDEGSEGDFPTATHNGSDRTGLDWNTIMSPSTGNSIAVHTPGAAPPRNTIVDFPDFPEAGVSFASMDSSTLGGSHQTSV